MGENVGDNKEFAVDGVKDVTVHFVNPGLTSADDTETDKYMNHAVSTMKYSIRNDQTVLLVGVNGRVFTDPVTIILNKGHKEDFKVQVVGRIVLRTTVASGTMTNIKVRPIG